MRLSSEELPQYYPDNYIRGFNELENGGKNFEQEAYSSVGYISET